MMEWWNDFLKLYNEIFTQIDYIYLLDTWRLDHFLHFVVGLFIYLVAKLAQMKGRNALLLVWFIEIVKIILDSNIINPDHIDKFHDLCWTVTMPMLIEVYLTIQLKKRKNPSSF